MSEVLTVSCSALNRYNDCPRSNILRFIRREAESEGYELAPSTPSAAAAIGTGAHAVMAELFRQKMGFGQMNFIDAIATGEEKMLNEVAKGAIWDATTPHVETAKKQLKALCNAFLPIAELIDPVAVEDELEHLISPLGREAVPIRLIGHRDVKDSRHEIHDHKTGEELPPCYPQLGGYGLLSLYRGEEVSALRINFAPRLPVSRLHDCKARSVRLDLQECLNAAWSTLLEIQRHYMRWLETKDSHVIPPNSYSQSCTEKYCVAYNTEWCKVGKLK